VPRSHLLMATAIAAVAAGLVAGCDKTPTRSIAVLHDARLEIVGPASIAPERTVQLNAVVHRSDGTTRDATNEAQWLSRDEHIVTVSSAGQATARARGETQINVSVPALQSTKTIFVLPDGTFRLSGVVRNNGAPIGGARVEVTGGSATGLVTMSDSVDGGYRLYGVAGETSILASKDGYESPEQRLVVTDHQTLNLEVTPVRVENVSGTYTMTITAAPRCSASLPAEARVRTYTAVLSQSGSTVVATLSGARFVIDGVGRGNRFGGWLDPGQLMLNFEPYDFYYYTYLDRTHADVIEEVAGGYLVIVGFAQLSLSPRRLVGRIKGEMDFFRTLPPAPRSAECFDVATGHEVVFAR
jgi:Carboxypeptidase regulatory-like domain